MPRAPDLTSSTSQVRGKGVVYVHAPYEGQKVEGLRQKEQVTGRHVAYTSVHAEAGRRRREERIEEALYIRRQMVQIKACRWLVFHVATTGGRYAAPPLPRSSSFYIRRGRDNGDTETA